MRNALDVSSQLILKSECSKPRRVPISTVITSDQKHVCIAIDDQIFLYDIRSGQRISVINQTDTVIALSSSSDNQLLVYLMNGLLIEYAIPSQAVVQYKQLNIQQKLLKIYQSPTTSNQIYAIIGDCYDTDEYFKNLNIIRIHTSADSTSIENVIKDESKFNISPKLTNLERLALSDKLCVGCVDNRVLVYAYESGKSVKYEYNSSKEELNKGLVNDFVSIKLYQKPEEEASKLIGVLHFGRILLWNIEMANKGSVRIVLMQSVHWHRGAPSVCLTSEQSLLSAGIEGVLVKYSSAVSNKSSLCSF
ncbi:unnamed protein product, partial [Anisakis simplex]|uniref:CNH domain-containing protein n=1 Tax=Anisakis simplex TaxID=6269 RepID=A0A0M3JEX4_ANISI